MNKHHLGFIVLVLVAIMMTVGLGWYFSPYFAKRTNQQIEEVKQALRHNQSSKDIEIKDEIACTALAGSSKKSPTPDIEFHGWTQEPNARNVRVRKLTVIRGSQIIAIGSNGEENTTQFFNLLRELHEKYQYKRNPFEPLNTGCLKIRYTQFGGKTYIYVNDTEEPQP